MVGLIKLGFGVKNNGSKKIRVKIKKDKIKEKKEKRLGFYSMTIPSSE